MLVILHKYLNINSFLFFIFRRLEYKTFFTIQVQKKQKKNSNTSVRRKKTLQNIDAD